MRDHSCNQISPGILNSFSGDRLTKERFLEVPIAGYLMARFEGIPVKKQEFLISLSKFPPGFAIASELPTYGIVAVTIVAGSSEECIGHISQLSWETKSRTRRGLNLRKINVCQWVVNNHLGRTTHDHHHVQAHQPTSRSFPMPLAHVEFFFRTSNSISFRSSIFYKLTPHHLRLPFVQPPTCTHPYQY